MSEGGTRVYTDKSPASGLIGVIHPTESLQFLVLSANRAGKELPGTPCLPQLLLTLSPTVSS